VRVVIVLNDLEVGGSERQALFLARHLATHADVRILGLERPGPLTALCDESGIPSQLTPFRWPQNTRDWLRGLPRFGWELRRMRPDVLLPYTMFPNVACGLIWRWVGARTCIWNQRDEGITRMRPGIEARAIARVPSFIANSNGGARFLAETLRAEGRRITVIRNGVAPPDPGMDRLGARRQFGLGPGTFVACMIGNVSRFKNHVDLLRAWRVAAERLGVSGMAAVLLLAGRLGSTVDVLRNELHQPDLAQTVRVLGYVADVAPVLAAADLALFSSPSEGCPNGVLEPMAAGLPVVATDIAGVREAVGAHAARFLAPAGDPAAMADRIVEFALDTRLRSRVGELNRERAAHEFSIDRMCEETVRVIAEALPSTGPRL
jgi:glycosyltransferase involved in cell wall biosynthesis